MSEGITCYERDETLCEDGMCLRTGCRLRNERLAMTDNAKELLALDPVGLNAAVRECARITAPEIDDAEFERIKADNSPRYRNTVSDMERVIRACLSARQQASARNLANAILDAPAGSATAMARALLAKYDIFQKVEG